MVEGASSILKSCTCVSLFPLSEVSYTVISGDKSVQEVAIRVNIKPIKSVFVFICLVWVKL